MSARRTAIPNRILDGLPPDEFARLAPFVEQVEIVLGQVLCNAGKKITHAVFPNAGIISLLAPADGDTVLELGLLGREGMFGIPLALGLVVSPMRALVQGAGSAIRIDAVKFRRVLKDCVALQNRLHRYTYSLMAHISQTAVCNNFHSIEARTARWMLSTSDRMQSDHFTLTQSFLADMLGVRRPAVSHAASALLSGGLVRYSRGEVSILDRPGLEAATCGCYRVIDDVYRTALG